MSNSKQINIDTPPGKKNYFQGQRLLECTYGSRYHNGLMELVQIGTLQNLALVIVCVFLSSNRKDST